MRVVLDTNVLVSAYIARGPEWKLTIRLIEGPGLLLTSEPILEELRRVLVSKLRRSPEKVDEHIKRLRISAELPLIIERLEIVLEDASDDKILECAVAGNADLIVTGDAHLLRLVRFRGIPIVRAADVP